MLSCLRVGLVAGEASGDTLGADLMKALRALAPEVVFFGVAGPKMLAQGCELWEPAESLAVMDLWDVVRNFPRLLRLRASIRGKFIAARPDIFIGIDAPDFNLGLARQLHLAGIPTVQYVSPQIWAWRQGRARTLHQAVDLVLCLLPFEKRFYDGQGIRAEFVGHPLADMIPLTPDRAAARRLLGYSAEPSVVALLPGSRRGEVVRLARDFALTAKWMAQHRAGLEFIAPMASHATREIFATTLQQVAPGVSVKFIDGEAQAALIAADVVLVTSGTASLEAALCKRAMVVIYRIGPVYAWLLRRLKLVKIKFFAQPNLLADKRIVSEYFQESIDPEVIGAELLKSLDDAAGRDALERDFIRIHHELKRDASATAARAILSLLSSLHVANRGS